MKNKILKAILILTLIILPFSIILQSCSIKKSDLVGTFRNIVVGSEWVVDNDMKARSRQALFYAVTFKGKKYETFVFSTTRPATFQQTSSNTGNLALLLELAGIKESGAIKDTFSFKTNNLYVENVIADFDYIEGEQGPINAEGIFLKYSGVKYIMMERCLHVKTK